MKRVGVERHRIEMLIAKSMVNRQGVVRQLQPDQIVQLICRELAKERGRVRRIVNKEIVHQAKYTDRVSRGYVQETLRYLLAALSGRKGTR